MSDKNEPSINGDSTIETPREKLAEAQLRALNQAAIVAITDARGRITFANDKFCQISGYSRNELIGQDHRLLNSGHHDKSFFTDMWRIIASGREWRAEICNRAKDGSHYWVDTSIAPVFDDSGKIIQYVAVRFPITDRKLAEEEQARRVRDLGQFAFFASHDLQTPARHIATYAGFLKRDLAKIDLPDAHESVDVIITSAKRMSQLIEDLLALSRTGRKALKIQDVSFEGLIDDCLAGMSEAIKDAGATVNAQNLPTWPCDRSLMVQVIFNLLGNSLKFRRPGVKLEITITARIERDELTLDIKDNGIGIKAEHFERIFQIFQRLHHADEYPGNGIGLSICQRIVERHGGRIGVQSAPGEGSTFSIILPRPLNTQK